MDQTDADFKIKAENVNKAFEAARNLIGHETINDASGRHFAWVSSEKLKKCTDFEEFMAQWRWHIYDATEPEFDDEGNRIQKDLDWISFNGEKLGDDKIIFDAIAPFVEPGSYIQMQGEDGSIWRWVFNGETCEEKEANITF